MNLYLILRSCHDMQVGSKRILPHGGHYVCLSMERTIGKIIQQETELILKQATFVHQPANTHLIKYT